MRELNHKLCPRAAMCGFLGGEPGIWLWWRGTRRRWCGVKPPLDSGQQTGARPISSATANQEILATYCPRAAGAQHKEGLCASSIFHSRSIENEELAGRWSRISLPQSQSHMDLTPGSASYYLMTKGKLFHFSQPVSSSSELQSSGS